MSKVGRRLTPTQWGLAINALAHVQADAECWESDGDRGAVPLWAGIEVIQQLIDARRPLGYAKQAQEDEGGE